MGQYIYHALLTNGLAVASVFVNVGLVLTAFLVGRASGWWTYTRKLLSRMPVATKEMLRARDAEIASLRAVLRDVQAERNELSVAARGCLSLLTARLSARVSTCQESPVVGIEIVRKQSAVGR
jgi:hypothetical protein